MKALAATLLTLAALALMLGDNHAGEKPKYTIKQVMKEAHKDKLLDKVVDGSATDADKKKLAELYKSLSQNTPKKGEAEAWKTKTVALVEAADKAVKGDAAAAASLKKLADCKGCHSTFK
jgi:hypothetical protein